MTKLSQMMRRYFDVYDSPYWDELYLDFIKQGFYYGDDERNFTFELICKLENKNIILNEEVLK
jgi:hypothetical protein